MQFYRPDPSDPDWLADAARFHGHLGPWVTVGAMMGRDAIRGLDTPGYWDVEVVCLMPPEKQQPPFSCILDGLQVTTGCTLGKRNIRFDHSPEVVRSGQPVVYVIRRPENDHAGQGLAYHLKDKLTSIMATITPDRLETISRQIAEHDIEELFEIRPLTPDELASVASRRPT